MKDSKHPDFDLSKDKKRRKMRIKKGLIVLGAIAFFCLAINTGRSKADGGIFIPNNFSGYETGQKAFIYFTNQSETLVVSANFRANAKDFSWVIPTPAKPEINKANSILFSDLEQMTDTDERPVESSGGLFGSGATKSSSVQIIEQKKVDVYDTAILKATDEKALANWLNAHGYNFPTDQNNALKSYVDNGWYFAIAKIQSNLVDQAKTENALMNGTLTPLKLTFTSDKIIYPMKLTGIALRSASPSATATASAGATIPPGAISETVSLDMPIKLYILADHKTQNDSLQTDWANWLSTRDQAKLNTDLGTNISTTDKYYLTAMSATIPAAKMVDDLTITNTGNDQVYPLPAYKTFNFYLINVISLIITVLAAIFWPVGLIFILFAILQRFAIKRKWIYILGSIYQILICLITLVIVGIILVATTNRAYILLTSEGAIGAFLGLLLTLAVEIFFTVKMFKRYKKTNQELK